MSGRVRPPKNVREALTRARRVLTPADIEYLRSHTLDEAQIELHFGLGLRLRNELGLAHETGRPLLLELQDDACPYPAMDPDGASSALIASTLRPHGAGQLLARKLYARS